MNIKELKEIIANLPDDTPVLEGSDEPGAALADCFAEFIKDPKDAQGDHLRIIPFV
jgi:hypothetical protein